MWRPIDSRKGEDDYCWMEANRCLLAPSDPPVVVMWCAKCEKSREKGLKCVCVRAHKGAIICVHPQIKWKTNGVSGIKKRKTNGVSGA